MKHPGVQIRDQILPRYVTVSALAKALGMQRPNASRLLNGKAGIGIRTALALERLGHGSAREWLIRQVDYELEEHQP